MSPQMAGTSPTATDRSRSTATSLCVLHPDLAANPHWQFDGHRRSACHEGIRMQVTRQRRDVSTFRLGLPNWPGRRLRIVEPAQQLSSPSARGWPSAPRPCSATTRSARSTATGSRSPTTRSSTRSVTACSPSSASSWARRSAPTAYFSRRPAPTSRWSCRSSTCRATSSSSRSAAHPGSTRPCPMAPSVRKARRTRRTASSSGFRSKTP